MVAMITALERKPRLAYRGCIATGEFIGKGNFLVGPAIDEAASYCESAEGAFVWLSPTAQRDYDAGLKAMDNHPLRTKKAIPYLIPSWSVPMKGGGVHETATVNPLCELDEQSRKKVSVALLGTFDISQPDIRAKGQNTARFLVAADQIQTASSGP